MQWHEFLKYGNTKLRKGKTFKTKLLIFENRPYISYRRMVNAGTMSNEIDNKTLSCY
jgi:hypothetical protein